MSVIWKEFPEINRSVAFTYNHVSPNLPLGCHCGSISGVAATFGSGYYGANGGRNIKVLDTKIEKQFAYVPGEYDYSGPPQVEIDRAVDYFKKVNLKFTDFAEEAYKTIVFKCSNLPLWAMSDAINYDAPSRKTIHPPGTVYQMYGSTGHFAQYLIDNKIGYVMASPIVQNPNHRSKTNYSLNRAWFWIPPEHLVRAIDVANAYGADQFPSKENWIKTIGGDIGIKTPEDVLKAILNDGVFPEAVGVFKNRGSDGRFKRKVALAEA